MTKTSATTTNPTVRHDGMCETNVWQELPTVRVQNRLRLSDLLHAAAATIPWRRKQIPWSGAACAAPIGDALLLRAHPGLIRGDRCSTTGLVAHASLVLCDGAYSSVRNDFAVATTVQGCSQIWYTVRASSKVHNLDSDETQGCSEVRFPLKRFA